MLYPAVTDSSLFSELSAMILVDYLQLARLWIQLLTHLLAGNIQLTGCLSDLAPRSPNRTGAIAEAVVAFSACPCLPFLGYFSREILASWHVSSDC